MITKSISILILVGLTGFGFSANAADDLTGDTTCYGLKRPDTSSNVPATQLSPQDIHQTIWCYKRVTSPRPAMMIYNADQEKIRPELAEIVEPDGTITHASLLKGKTTLHKLKGSFNPLGVPLSPPTEAPVFPAKTDPTFTNSVTRALNVLMTGTGEWFTMRVQPGTYSAITVTADRLPWRGFWWSWAGGWLHSGDDSPLAKYDKYVSARTHAPSLAQIWESVEHAPNGNPWAGHCNGWAASAIMRPEPTQPITDPTSGVTFKIGDLKGILAVQDFCVATAFFGTRYNGWPGEDVNDIYPGDFHNVVLYYIGQLHKPVAMDRHSGPAVDNHVASAYTMDIKKEGDHYSVVTTLTMHSYDSTPEEPPGPAPSYKRDFKYLLWLGPKGEVIKAKWLNENPDFMWVPLAPLDGCDDANPYVTEEMVDKLFGY